MSKVLAHGRPMVCLPLLGDQPSSAARIERLGAGLRLPPDARPAAIGAAVRRVLDEPAFRLSAESHAAAIEREDPRPPIVGELEAMVPARHEIRGCDVGRIGQPTR